MFSDVVGPTRTPSVGGARYFVTLLDEYRGYFTGRFVRRRIMAGSAVIEMIKEIEKLCNQTIRNLHLFERKSVKCLRSDNSKEYLGKELQK